MPNCDMSQWKRGKKWKRLKEFAAILVGDGINPGDHIISHDYFWKRKKNHARVSTFSESAVKVPGSSQSESLCGARPFRSPTGDVVLVVADVAPIWISAPHNALVASLHFRSPFSGNPSARKVLYYKYLNFVASRILFYSDLVMPQGKYYFSLPKLMTLVTFWHVMKTKSCQAYLKKSGNTPLIVFSQIGIKTLGPFR
jgi:hypothetical protein